MSKHFYKDVKLIKYCKKCQVQYRPARYTFFAALGLCWNCRRPYYQEWYQKFWKPWYARLTPEAKEKYKKAHLVNWKAWVLRNEIKRRRQALESYHRRKEDLANKKRKHRATTQAD